MGQDIIDDLGLIITTLTMIKSGQVNSLIIVMKKFNEIKISKIEENQIKKKKKKGECVLLF